MSETAALTGLARQIVMAELLDESKASQALAQAQKNKIPLVTYLVQNKLVNGRKLADLASENFGVPFLTWPPSTKKRNPKTW